MRSAKMLRRGATEATVEEVRRRQWKRVGVLGFGDPVIYTERLGRLGIACATADAGWRTSLDGAVFRRMEGRDDVESAAAADLINPVQLLAEAAVR